MHNFRELKIWQDAITLSGDIFGITRTFPSEEKFSLTSQLNRSAVSIPSNIAEGSSRSNKEFRKYLDIALGSCFELETQIILSNKFKYISQTELNLFLEKTSKLQSMITNFKKRLL